MAPHGEENEHGLIRIGITPRERKMDVKKETPIKGFLLVY